MKTSRSTVQSALRAVALTAAVALVAAAGTAVVSQTSADPGARLADATVSGSPSDSPTPTADPTASPSQELQQLHVSVPPWVVGQLHVGGTIRAQFAVDFKPNYAYQWLRDGVEIPGATGKEYVPVLADGNHHLGFRCVVTKDGYAPLTIVSPKVAVQPADMEVLQVPHLTGTPAVGSKLTIRLGKYSPTPTSFQIFWFRNNQPIPSDRGKTTHRLTKADRGKNIFVRVFADRDGYTEAQRDSASVHVR